MPRRRIGTTGGTTGLCALIAGGWLLAAAPAQAQTTANGPYYAIPSWDQTLPAATRFIILSNFNSEAVLDRNTGLVWERSPSTTQSTWQNARGICVNKNVGAQKGWRLPVIAELASLVDPSVPFPGPSLQSGHPFLNVQSAGYWSASTNAVLPSDAWFVNLSSGFVGAISKSGTSFVWCVRGGNNADAY